MNWYNSPENMETLVTRPNFLVGEAKYNLAHVEPEVLHPIDFLKDFLFEINNAVEGVKIRTMHAEFGHGINLLFHSLEKAAERGVDVDVRVDGFTRLICDEKPTFINLGSRDDQDHLSWMAGLQREMFDSLIDKGGC